MGVDVKKAEIVSAEEGKRLATMFGCIASATALSAWASWVLRLTDQPMVGWNVGWLFGWSAPTLFFVFCVAII
jgi:hypothetical protein